MTYLWEGVNMVLCVPRGDTSRKSSASRSRRSGRRLRLSGGGSLPLIAVLYVDPDGPYAGHTALPWVPALIGGNL